MSNIHTFYFFISLISSKNPQHTPSSKIHEFITNKEGFNLNNAVCKKTKNRENKKRLGFQNYKGHKLAKINSYNLDNFLGFGKQNSHKSFLDYQ